MALWQWKLGAMSYAAWLGCQEFLASSLELGQPITNFLSRLLGKDKKSFIEKGLTSAAVARASELPCNVFSAAGIPGKHMVVKEAACSMQSMCLGTQLSKLVLLPKSGRPSLSRSIWIPSGIANRDFIQNFTQYAFKVKGQPDCCMLGGNLDPNIYILL